MKKTLPILINLLIAILTPYAWFTIVRNSSDPVMTSAGLNTLKYFTVLSNLLSGFAALLYLMARLRKKMSRRICLLKYIAAVSVGLTLMVVLLFLGPLYGFFAMFSGPSFWLHLTLPLLAMADFVLFNGVSFTRRDNLLAVLPMLIYGIGYTGNNLINGIGAWPHSNDWYAFLSWGYPIGFCIMALIALLTFLIGLALRKANDRFRVK